MNPLLPPAHLDAGSVVRASGSSFRPAFRLLPAAQAVDLQLLYALCRAVDDIADSAGHSDRDRRAALAAWRKGFADGSLAGLPDNLRDLVRRRSLDTRLFLELLDGTETDLAGEVRMATRRELDVYCHRVAGVVGRLCLPIFGADPARCSDYAGLLGRALQYTNILRDVADDFARGRVYFPLDELAAAGVEATDLAADGAARRAYLKQFAAGTDEVFEQAARALPREDRAALRPARVMGAIYRTLLGKLRQAGPGTPGKRCRLNAGEKLAAVAAVLAGRQ
jgi:phytoene synthase